jgi:hypothetical protein
LLPWLKRRTPASDCGHAGGNSGIEQFFPKKETALLPRLQRPCQEMGDSSQCGDLICRCISLAAHASASGFIEGERVIAMSVLGGISIVLASTMQELAFIPLEADAVSLALASVSGALVACCPGHFIVHHRAPYPAAQLAAASAGVATAPLSQFLWTACPAVDLLQFTDACTATCSHARTIAFGTTGCIKVFRLQDAPSVSATYACIRTLHLPRGMRVTCISVSTNGNHVCWCCEGSCLVQLLQLPTGDEVPSPVDSAPFHILLAQPVRFVSWLQPPGAGIRCSDLELDDVIISADISGCIVLSKLMQSGGDCLTQAVNCARIHVPSLQSIACVSHAPGSDMRATDSVLAFATVDASAKLVVWCAKGIIRRRLPLLAAEGVTSCSISQAMTTALPASPHQACDMWAWSESSISSHDSSTVDPSVLCITAFNHPFFATSSILSAAAVNCTALTGINHRGRVVQLEAQSLGGLMLSRDCTSGVIVWHAHEPSSALLPRYWGSASAATLVQLRPSDTFGAAVLLSIVDTQPAGALTFDVSILIDDHVGVAGGSFSQHCQFRVQIPAVPQGSTVNCIKSWKLTAGAMDGLSAKLGCLIDTNCGVWWLSFEREADGWTSSEARLFQDCSVAICVGLSSNDDSIWSISGSGSVSRAVCDNRGQRDVTLASQPWAQLPDLVQRAAVLVDAPDSASLCVVSRDSMYLLFDCNGRACVVARGSLPSFPNNMQCWFSCAGSVRICCVYDGHVRICSLGTENIYTQHLVHFASFGANLGAVLDDKLYASSHRGVMRLSIDLENKISFSASPRRAAKGAPAVWQTPESAVQVQDTSSRRDSGSDFHNSDSEGTAPACSDEHCLDPSSLSWLVPWFACFKSKGDYLKMLSSDEQEDKIAAISELLQPQVSSGSGSDWMAAARPPLPPHAAPPARFTNMKERRANASTIGAVLSAYCNSGLQYMWQSGWFVAWAALNDEQPQLLNELSQMYEERHSSLNASANSSSSSSSSNMSWSCASWCGAPLWLADTTKLSQLLLACGRAT